MAGGYSIGVAMDARAVEKGVKAGIIEPVEDAVDKLQDLGRAGDDAGDGIGRGLRDGERQLDQLGRAGKDAGDDVRDGARKGEQELDKLGRAGKDAGDDLRDGARDGERGLDQLGKAGKEAGDDLETGLKGAQKETARTAAEWREMTKDIEAQAERAARANREAFRDAGGATGEFKDEALSNFSEVTSSFTGDMQSITDLAQGTFGGLASIGGPASLAFGAVAVAVGLIGSALTAAGEESEEFKEKIAGLAQAKLSDLFGDYQDSGDELARGLRDWATDADTFGGSIADLKKNAGSADLPFDRLAEAIGRQSVPQMRALRKETEEQIDTFRRQAATLSDGTAKGRIAAKASEEQAEAAKRVKDQLDQNLGAYDAEQDALKAIAATRGETVKEYMAGLEEQKAAEEAKEQASEQAKADEEARLQERQANLEEWAGVVTSVFQQAAEADSEAIDNGKLNAQSYAEGLEKRTAAAQQFQANLQAIGEQLPGDLFDFVRSQGPGFSEEIATYLAATPEQQERIRNGWKVAAQITADTTEVDAATAEQGKKRTAGPTAEVQGDTSDLDKKVAEKGKEKTDGPVSKIRPDDEAVRKSLDKLAAATVTGPTVRFRVDDSEVNAAVNRLTRTVTKTVRIVSQMDDGARRVY